jgi:hypothetical protein
MESYTVHDSRPLLAQSSTIEDAIHVTLALGLQYLWVDRYCINHTENSEITSQLQQMHKIYRYASFTIIACAGEDPSYGLPGVSRPRRKVQTDIDLNCVHLRTFRFFPWSLVRRSRWNSRGWTYQEHLFSRKCLFFTNEQVIFAPYFNWICETIQTPQEYFPELEIAPRYGEEKLSIQPLLYHNQMSVLEHIAEYTRRSLSFPTDILNAFTGILNDSMTSSQVFAMFGVYRSSQRRHGLSGIKLLRILSCPIWPGTYTQRRFYLSVFQNTHPGRGLGGTIQPHTFDTYNIRTPQHGIASAL